MDGMNVQMDFGKTERGFGIIKCSEHASSKMSRLVQESSSIGDYSSSLELPGSSSLWIGDKHLNREAVMVLALSLTHWLRTGKLPDAEPQL